MSIPLFKFAQSFVEGKLSAIIFAEAYMEFWKIERDLQMGSKDPEELNECLFTLFCLADMYDPDPDSRLECELDDKGLLRAVKKEITLFEHRQKCSKKE